MKRRLFALALALLLAVSLPVSALARDWYIDEGDITIRATENGQTVSQGDTTEADDAPVIKQKDSSKSTSNTITIDAEEKTTANVTLDGVNIDASSREEKTAGIRTTGDGNVTIELDGNNSVKSAADAAGLQKNNSGNLTIKDGNTTAGKLEATGGRGGAGIGGGANESASNITITGGEIIATGGNGGAGIGGGRDSGPNSASGILISGGKVTATGGDFGGAGIGGGNWSSASDITITGGEVTAKGGTNGAGIGGGWNGRGGNLSVSISGDAQVKVQGGDSDYWAGAGAGIGNGGSGGGSLSTANGDEVEPDTSGLTENGKLEYYAPGKNMATDAPEKVIENKPETEPEPSGDHAQPGASAPVYSVTDKDGNAVSYTAAREGGVLTIRVDAAYARLTLTAAEAQALTAQGVENVVFITTGATSAFRPADLTAYASEAPFVLTHDGETVTFTAGETDLASLLLQA